MEENKNTQLMPICHKQGKSMDDKPMASTHQYPSKPRQLLLQHSKIFQNQLENDLMPKWPYYFFSQLVEITNILPVANSCFVLTLIQDSGSRSSPCSECLTRVSQHLAFKCWCGFGLHNNNFLKRLHTRSKIHLWSCIKDYFAGQTCLGRVQCSAPWADHFH